ncbi:acyl-CoA N-acyltransferase [Sparassis latifolia]
MSRSVRKANKASTSQLSASLVTTLSVNGSIFHCELVAASELSREDRDTVWRLLEGNMRDLALTSSLGWNESAKQDETFHALSRFILVRKINDENEGIGSRDSRNPLVAFTMFRFEHEYKEDIIYCYEMQVCETERRHGLGRHLVHQLASMGKTWRMEKIILTVLKANPDARQFYAKMGFELDPTSPGYKDPEEDGSADEDEVAEDCDYEILSMMLR